VVSGLPLLDSTGSSKLSVPKEGESAERSDPAERSAESTVNLVEIVTVYSPATSPQTPNSQR
jgi:hypothetical protein